MLYQLSYFRKNNRAGKLFFVDLFRKISLICLFSNPASFGGRGWIRTTEGSRQQIYSLSHLATLVLSQTFPSRCEDLRSFFGLDAFFGTQFEIFSCRG